MGPLAAVRIGSGILNAVKGVGNVLKNEASDFFGQNTSTGKSIFAWIIFGVALLGFVLFLAVAGAASGNQLGVNNPREPGGQVACGPGETCDPADLPPATGNCAGIANVARAEVGVVELAPDTAPRIQQFTNGRVEAWCADFVSWVLWQSGNRLPPSRTGANYSPTDPTAGREASVLSLQSYFNSAEIGLPPGSAVQAGDIVFYDWRRCGSNGDTHTGIVVSYNAEARRFTSVEGNMGIGNREGVGTRSGTSVSSSCIIGFGRLRNCQTAPAVMEYFKKRLARNRV